MALGWLRCRAALLAAAFAIALLFASACADSIPVETAEEVVSTDPTSTVDCAWYRWFEHPISLGAWFAAHPETAALHWWDDEHGTFRAARRDRLQDASFGELRRTMTVWREPVGATSSVTAISAEQAAGVIELNQGVNLVAWYGDTEPPTTVREAFRWIGPNIVSITRIDSSRHTCHRDFETELTGRRDFSAQLGQGDLLAIEMRDSATWTQSWTWSPIPASFGHLDTESRDGLNEQIREVSGFMAARYALAAESYLVMLLSDIRSMYGAYEALTGGEFDTSWWPEGACGVGWVGGIGLLKHCREPIAFDHEYVHVLQHQLARGGVGSSWEIEPMWLIEGTAEYVAARYRDAMDYQSYGDARELVIGYVREHETEISLDELETREEFRQVDPGFSYGLGMLAAEWLAARYGDDSLFEYQRQLSRAGNKWRFAFEVTFGITAQEFYDAFADHSAEFEEPRPHVIRGIVVDAEGQGVPNLSVHAYPSSGGASLVDQTGKQGEFAIEVRAARFLLAVHSQSRCTFYGTLGEGGRLASWLDASPVTTGTGQEVDVVLRLTDRLDNLGGWSTCRQAETTDALGGRVLDPSGNGVPNVHVLACGVANCGRSVTDETGAYSIDAADDTLTITIGPANSTCHRWGLLGPEGILVPIGDNSPPVAVQRLKHRVDVHLPVPVAQLEAVDTCW